MRLDLNSPQFLDVFLRLEVYELRQVVKALDRIRGLDWQAVYTSSGLNWEAVDHIITPNKTKAHTVRLSLKTRAIVYRDRDSLCFVSLHPDHDSAYRR